MWQKGETSELNWKKAKRYYGVKLIDLEWIQACVQTQSYRYSLHGERERVDDTLDFGEVEQALLSDRKSTRLNSSH